MTTRTTFDPLHKGSLVALTNGNRDMVLADQQQTARVTVGRDATLGGVACFELVRLADGSFTNVPTVGLVLGSDPYDGSGMTGYTTGSGRNGWSCTDSGVAANIWHNQVSTGLSPTIMGGIGAQVIALGCVHRVAAGALDIYAIRSVGNGNPILCHTISGLPTTGIFYPTLGWGNVGVTTEAYRWNGGVDAVQVHDGPDWRPVGSLMWDDSLHQTATRADWRCQGARYSAGFGALAAISSPFTRRIVLANPATDTSLWADSGALDGAPGALVYGSTLWTVCSDGYVRKLNTTTAALISSVNTYADTTAWLAINAEGVVIAPASKGAVSTISGTSVVSTLPVLPRVDAAVYTTGRYLYCFGPGGTGAVVTVSAAGALQKIGTFNATNCRDIRRAKLMPDGTLVVACKNKVVEFSLTDPTAPVVSLSTSYSTEVFSVADDNAHTTITADTRLGGEVPIYDATLNGTDYILVGPTPYVRVAT